MSFCRAGGLQADSQEPLDFKSEVPAHSWNMPIMPAIPPKPVEHFPMVEPSCSTSLVPVSQYVPDPHIPTPPASEPFQWSKPAFSEADHIRIKFLSVSELLESFVFRLVGGWYRDALLC